MIVRILRSLRFRLKKLVTPNPDAWLKNCSRLLHVGANDGPEIPLYRSLGLEVVWVEALPDVFLTLEQNLRGVPKQKAFQALVTDKEGDEHVFHVASNQGASSSIFELKDHVHLWPEIHYVKDIKLRSRRLANLLEENGYAPNHFDAAVLDVQGAELLVLQGAGAYLDNLRLVCCEVADFEAYAGACDLNSLTAFMAQQGFTIKAKQKFHHAEKVGTYYNVLFARLTNT